MTLPVSPATTEPHARRREPMNILLCAAGRRVALMRLLEESIRSLGIDGQVIASDITDASPAMRLAGHRLLVPPYSDPSCLDSMLNVCRQNRIKLIIPTIDPDLDFLTRHRDQFARIGAEVMVSAPEAIAICNDKRATHSFLEAHGFPTVRQIEPADLLARRGADWTFPLFIKPVRGSASIGARIAIDAADLEAAMRGHGDLIAQELARGREYTVDVYVDLAGACRAAVPRWRMATRGGEVAKGMTVRFPAMQELAWRVAEALPGAWGVLNIQIFHDPASDRVLVSEINARFGGGYPLTHEAGAPMARWIIEESLGRPISPPTDEWRDGVVMLRYDEAVFVDAAAIEDAGPKTGNPP